MVQVASAATRAAGSNQISSLPRIPLFIRAAELSAAVSLHAPHASVEIRTLEQLAGLFISIKYKDNPPVASMLIEFLKLKHMLIFIDGLDEAADNRCLVEECIDRASRDNNIGLMVSTREYAFESSLVCHRLSAFDPVKIQPLDNTQRTRLIERRLPGASVHDFCTRLEHSLEQSPEMASSPLLLCLLIEVFKTEGTIPIRRHEVYERLVQGVLVSHMEKYGKEDVGSRKRRRVLQNVSGDAAEFLQSLAFVCHMRLNHRDFQWDSPAIKTGLQEIWKITAMDSSLESMGRRLLLDPCTVGLISKIGDGQFRFSHLTLQEYLAAKCIVRLYGHDVQQLVDQLMPLHSRWTREVAKFVACMLSAKIFTSFCELVLESDDGAGAQCEMVQDFLREFGPCQIVEQMVRNKLLKIRGTDSLVAGLCHPSQELRDRVLSEMKRFRMPPDPFAQSDGTVAQLKHIAEHHDCEWYTRAAAILSMVQIAQMDHCQEGTGREDTLRWVLDLLGAGEEKATSGDPLGAGEEDDTHFALVKSLGTCLKGVGNDGAADCIMLSSQDEQQIFVWLNRTLHNKKCSIRGQSEVLADLNAYSEGLLDWVLLESLIEKGKWSLRHVKLFCEKNAGSVDSCRANRLCQQLLDDVTHPCVDAASIEAFQKQDDLLKGLGIILTRIGPNETSEVLRILEYGQAHQRIKVLCVAAGINMQFTRPIVDDLARCLLLALCGGIADQSLLTNFLELEYTRHESGPQYTNPGDFSRVFHYLQTVMEPGALDGGAPQQVTQELKYFELMIEERKREHKREPTGDREQWRPEQEPEQEPEHENLIFNNKFDQIPRIMDDQLYDHTKSPVIGSTFFDQDKASPVAKVLGNCDQTPSVPSKLDAPKQESEHLSLETLAVAVKTFMPKILKTSNSNVQNPLNLYLAAKLWESSGLVQQGVSTRLSLSDLQRKMATEKFEGLLGCRENIGSWEQAVCKTMKDHTMGRLFFGIVLKHVQDSYHSSPETAMDKLKVLEDRIKQWQTSNAGEQLEQRFLLKELLIGCRSQQLPTWTGVVSSMDYFHRRDKRQSRTDVYNVNAMGDMKSVIVPKDLNVSLPKTNDASLPKEGRPFGSQDSKSRLPGIH